jgi:hypothetical protein
MAQDTFASLAIEASPNKDSEKDILSTVRKALVIETPLISPNFDS